MRIPALRDPNATLEEKTRYLNYMYSVINPGLISTEYPIYVYWPLLLGTDRYTQRTTFRFIRPFAGEPLGPVRRGMDVGLAR